MECNNRYDGTHTGRYGGDIVVRRLQVGLTKTLDVWLSEMAEKNNLSQGEYVRRLMRQSPDYKLINNQRRANNNCPGLLIDVGHANIQFFL